ncbi:MAG: TonB C-terminal domain-containing protein [Deltaproteobacteria bacterium]|nr:TonB C-terminal domain-containing protein [Deltaproteobacteria bacterium]MBN2672794.1 TonB C-terminal domain-containing protein [Deltaproteobacteria bacterium]
MDFTRIDIIAFEAIKPPQTGQDPVALAGGTAGVIVFVIGLLLLPILEKAVGTSTTDTATEPPLEYIEARLLKAGEIKDETELPDRIVPALPTAPEEVIPLDQDADKPEPPPKEEEEPEKQADAVDDTTLREVFEKARAFAEIQDDFVPEGHPDGVPDGDVTDPALASLGATYGRRITKYIKERWIVPTLISDSERQQLKLKVTLKFNAEMTIIEFNVISESGNRLFDDSVVNAIELTQKEVRHLPEPPDAIASRIYGGGLTITMRGADAPIQ